MKKPKQFVHFGKPMSYHPANYESLLDLVEFMENGLPCRYVHLEPGDATRYTLILMPVREMSTVPVGIDPRGVSKWMMVLREVGGKIIGGGYFNTTVTPTIHDVEPLANDNLHSAEFLQWWLTCLFYTMEHNEAPNWQLHSGGVK